MRMNKRGVSLITVLLFMMVATIAATATFKWLTSGNSSSSSRMMMNEARQSATAGLDAARSWMSFNANDVGAMVRSFYDGNQKPVKLNNVLNPLSRDGQSYDVFLTAVDTENSSYKMKLVSVGKARDGKAKYSESAILKVNGLYHVKVPVRKVVGNINYEFDYFGGSTSMGTNTRSSSMLVNGNLVGSQIGISKNLVVTGNLSSDQTNHLLLGKNSCVGGNLIVSNQGVGEGENLYVNGDVTGFTFSDNSAVKKFLGSAYFNGNVTMSTTGAGVEFDSNMTLNGKLTLTSQMKKKFTVGGNTCLGPNAEIDFASPANDNQGGFLAKGDVWIPKGDALSGSNMGNSRYVILGSGSSSDVFVKNIKKCDKYYHVSVSNNNNIYLSKTKNLSLTQTQSGSAYTYDECPENTWLQLRNAQDYTYYYGNLQWRGYVGFGEYYYPESGQDVRGGPFTPFTSLGTLHSNLGSSAKDDGVTCSDGIKAYCDEYFGESRTGCDGSHYKIDDILMPAVESFSSSEYETECVAKVVALGRDDLANGKGVEKLNACYTSVPAAQKFGEYLVVKIKANKLSEIFVDPKNYFVGKFILLVDEEENSPSKVNGKVPGTDGNSVVFLYLPNGAGTIQKSGNAPKWNYFIYSLHDVESLGTPGDGANVEWNGSFYMSAKNCAKIKQVSDRQEFVYNPFVLEDLTANSIVCPYEDGGACEVDPSTPESSSGSGTEATPGTPEGYDSYFISTSPQLSITLESQYKNEELNPDELTGSKVTEIKPSYIVLPRIIYLPRDPVGRLSDYFTVMGLNGAKNQDGTSGVTCPAEISTSADLYDPDNPVQIKEGVYTCKFQKDQVEIPFYVVVKGILGANPPVSFETVELETAANATVPVKLKVKKGDREMTATIMAPSAGRLGTGWSYTPQSGTTLVKDDGTTSVYEWKGTPPTDAEITVFNVVTTSSAGQGDIVFQLTDPCDGCFISSPFAERVFVTGRSTIVREELVEYCKKYPDNCNDENDYEKIAKRPNCGNLATGEWVRASGTNCIVNTANQEWNCITNTPISLAGTVSSQYCDLFIPQDDNSVEAPEDKKTYPLYASLKRKPYTLTVKREGTTISEVQVFTSSTAGPFGPTPTHVCKSDLCEFEVYANDRVQLKYDVKGDDKFSYWRSQSPNSPTTEPVPDGPFTLQPISANNTVLAKFNDKDLHCFYEDFTEMKAFCNDDKHCIADCAGGSKGGSCTVDYLNSVPNWQLAYGNGKNGGDNVAPVLDGKSISSSNDKNSSNKNGGQTIIMSTKLTGKNGKMSAMLQTTIFKSKGTNNEGVNSGFIFRSGNDAAKYLILNIFGYGDGKNASSGVLTARLCVASGQSSTNSNGTCKEAAFSSSSLSVTTNTMVKLNMVIEDNKLRATAEADGKRGSLTFDLTGDYDVQGEYLGMSVSDSWFKLFDFGWESSSFPNEGCFDVPTLTCSFKANYLGGIVPKDSLVTPWAAASSWFSDNGCWFTYYYNGDDNQTLMSPDPRYGHRLTGENFWPGPFGFGASVKYNFSEDGLHGPTDKDAVVVVNCPMTVNTSLNGKSASCGNFQVGSVEVCSKDYGILMSPETFYGSDLEIPTSESGNGINLRESVLWLTINDLAENQNVEVVLKDAAGKISQPEYIYTNGAHSLNVNVMSNVELFDPQRIVSVILKGTSGFSVASIQSSCPYAVSVTNCSAWYDGTSWQISSTILNAKAAASNGCAVTTDNSGIEGLSEVTCPANGRFTLPDADFYTELNKNDDAQTFKFSVHAKSADGEEVTPCEAEATYKSVDIACDVNDVVKGSGFTPELKFSIDNCPTSGCPYTVKLDDGPEHEGTYISSEANWNANASTSDMEENSVHVYKISTMGKTKECKFTVKPQIKATGSCSISGSVVSIDVTGSNYQSVPVTLGLSDGIGNVLGHEPLNINQNLTTTVDLATKNLSPGTTYTVTLTLNEDGIVCGMYTEPEAESSSSGSVSATCAWENNATEFWPGQNNVKLVVSNITGLSNDQSMTLTCGDKTTSSTCRPNGGCDNLQFTVPSSSTTCTLGNATVGTICSPVLTIREPLSCSVSKSIVAYGEKFTFTGMTATSQCHNCKLYDGTKEYTNNQNNIEQEITFNYTTAKTFTYECQCDNMTSGHNKCTQIVATQIVAPNVTCPTSAYTVAPNGSVSFTPATLTGCGTGCDYAITRVGYSTTKASITNGSYTTASLISFNADNGSGGDTYRFTVTNSEGSDDCDFDVTYAESSSSSAGGGGTTTITLNYGGDLTTLTGGTYIVYSTNQWSGAMRCEADEQVTIQVNGINRTVYTDRRSIEGASPRTNVSVTVVVPAGKSIRCHTDW